MNARWMISVGLLLALVPAAPSRAPAADSDGKWLELKVELQNLLLLRNDDDFDRTEPAYDENGQSVGVFATLLRPAATFHILDNLRLYYEVELGLNFWSKQNPDQADPTADDTFLLKHREMWGAGEFYEDALAFKVGYQRLQDSTGLFLNHWIGALELRARWGSRGSFGLFIGQLPDQTYEGLQIGDNNFERDIFVFGADLRLELKAHWSLAVAVDNLYDTHEVDRTRRLVGPNGRLRGDYPDWTLWVDAALQVGRFEGAARGGDDQDVLGWAGQLHVEWRPLPFVLTGNLLLLSPDDAHVDNSTYFGFQYSGKSTSATVVFTEDELRDHYNNLDERMSAYHGGFFSNRAGLMVVDVKAAWQANELLRPALVVGAASVLKPENALDQAFVGVEIDALLELSLGEHLLGQALFSVVVPGGAAGALVNRIELAATDPLLLGEVSLLLRY